MHISKLIRSLDWPFFLSIIILTLIGMVSIYSSSKSFVSTDIGIKKQILSQLVFVIVAIIIYFVFTSLNIYFLQNFSFYFYLLGIFLLIMTLLLGKTVNQSKSWLDLGILSFQPSEFMKIAFILYLAYFFGKKSFLHLFDFFKSILILLVPLTLILFQPDLGTALVYVFIWICMVFASTLSFRLKISLLLFAFMVPIIFLVSIQANIISLKPYQIDRMRVFPDHLYLSNLYHDDVGYQVDQSLIAIGSSGMFGKGLSMGTQSQYGFLPESLNDFVYSATVEEMGIFVGIIIIILIFYLIWRIYMISTLNIPSSIYFLLVGIISMISFHVIQNVGMNLGVMPVTGIPMPFISMGGSFLITIYALLGMSESVYLRYQST